MNAPLALTSSLIEADLVELSSAAVEQALAHEWHGACLVEAAAVTRSIHLAVSYDRPGTTRDAIAAALDAGFTHVVLGLPAPFPVGVAQWAADELITRSV